jgi:serine-type D-Ala-D-Ala carboxypeptidase (penicillin-binding protein 5/6)
VSTSRFARLAAVIAAAIGALILAPARSQASSPPSLNVTGAILIAPQARQQLYGVNPQRQLPIASTTKLMTALITLEHVRHLSKVLTAPDYYAAATDSQIGLVPGERMSVHDLLLALLLPSADDAAEDLAFNVGHGSVARFVDMMNARARALGLRHTHYSTPSGLDTPGNYSTPADLVKLASYDLRHSAYFARVVGLRNAVLRSGNHIRYVVNRNDLVGRVPWIHGVKTGHTAGAGYVLVAAGHRDGMTLVSAVLGTTSEGERDANTLALLDYGFRNFHWVKPVTAGAVLARPTVRDRPGMTAAVIASRGFERILPRSDRVRVRVQAPRRLAGPMRRHAPVGTATVVADGRPIARIELVLARALPAVSGLTIAARFITKPLMLLIIVVMVAALITLVIARRRRTRAVSGDSETA